MEDSDFDGIYGQEDVFDEEEHARLVQSLCETKKPREIRQRGRGAVLFRSLGINVTKWLLTYLCVEDMIKFTSLCRWLYRFGSDPEVLDSYGLMSENLLKDPDWNIRRSFIEKHRSRVLQSSKDLKLKKDVVFDPQFTNLFHVENVSATLVFFSLFNSRALLWKYNAADASILLSVPGPPTIVSHAVTESGLVLLGERELVATWTPWRSFLYHEKSSHSHLFPTAQTYSFVRVVESCRIVVTLRHSHLTVFSSDLQPISEASFEPTVRCWAYGISLLVPYSNQPYVVSVFRSAYFITNVSKQCNNTRTKQWSFIDIVQADCVTVSSEQGVKSYLLCLGTKKSTTLSLYANDRLLRTNVSQFKVFAGEKIACLVEKKIVVLATRAGIVELVEVSGSVSDVWGLYPNYSTFVTLSRTRIHDKDAKYIESTVVSYFGYQKQKLFSESLAQFVYRQAYSFRSVLVLAGNYQETGDRCLILMHYFLDEQVNALSVEKAMKQWHLEMQPYSRAIVPNAEREKAYIERRLQRKAERQETAEYYRFQSSRYWKSKRRKHDQIHLTALIFDMI